MRASSVDFGLWGALVPGAELEELAERGVIGLKAFMSNPGIEDFARADDVTLYEGMATAARLGLPVAVHAENDALTARSLGPDGAGLDELAAGGRRARGDLPRDHVRGRHRLRAAHRARLERRRRRARHGSACARRGRDLRDVPALPVPHARAGRAARPGGQVRAADPRRGGPGRAVGAPARGRDRLRHVRPLPQLARPEGRDVRRGVGRDRGRADDAGAAGRRARAAAGGADGHGRGRAVRRSPARVRSSRAPTPTSRSSTSAPNTPSRRRICATGTSSRPTSGGGCRPASFAPWCAGWTRRRAWESS